MRRIQPAPFDAVEGAASIPAVLRRGGVADVGAVAGGVLSDEVEFKCAIGDEFFGFRENVGEGLGTHATADAGDGAERAALVAAF